MILSPDPKDWPNSENPGFPQRPELEADHYLLDERGVQFRARWYSHPRTWTWATSQHVSASDVAKRWKYVGPAPSNPQTVTGDMPPRPGPRPD